MDGRKGVIFACADSRSLFSLNRLFCLFLFLLSFSVFFLFPEFKLCDYGADSLFHDTLPPMIYFDSLIFITDVN